MAEKSSFMGKKIEFQGEKSSLKEKNRVFRFIVKSISPQKAQKKPESFKTSEIRTTSTREKTQNSR